MVTVGVVAMGEMGSGIARRLVERGTRVLTSIDGRSAASLERAKAAGVEPTSDANLIGQIDIFLSIVPPAVAASTADRFRTLMHGGENRAVYIDCNAVAPQTLDSISKAFQERDLRFGDASIIGLAPRRDGYTPRVYMSGAVEHEATILGRLGLETRFISNVPGDASALKMAYAGITKGVLAIGTAMAIGAARAGTADYFAAELMDTQPQLYAWLCKMLPTMYAKAYRWNDEMLEIARFLEPERGATDMFMGAAELYQHIAEENAAGPGSELIGIMRRFVEQGKM